MEEMQMEMVGCNRQLIELRRRLETGKYYTLMRRAFSISTQDREGSLMPCKAKLIKKGERKATFMVYVRGGKFRECYQYWDLWKGVLKDEK